MHRLKRILTAFAVIILIATFCTTIAFADSGIVGDAAGSEHTGTAALKEDSSRISSQNGAWEVSFYNHGRFRGAFLLGDPQVMKEASNSNLTVLDTTPWHFSNGVRLSDGPSTATIISLETDPEPVPKYANTDAVLKWGEKADVMYKLILAGVLSASDIDRGDMTADEVTEIVAMLTEYKNTSDEQVVKDKMASGEWSPFFVTMRPVMLTYQIGIYAGSGPAGEIIGMAGKYYQFNNREQQHRKFEQKGSDNWYHICGRMNQVWHENEYGPGDHGQGDESWPFKETVWTGINRLEGRISRLTGKEGNYAIFYFDPTGASSSSDDGGGGGGGSIPTPGEMEELRVRSYEILGAPFTSFDTARNSNKFANNVKAITIKENTESEAMTRIHEVTNNGTCSAHNHSCSGCCEGHTVYDEITGEATGTKTESDCHDNYDPCGGTLKQSKKCGRDYKFTWDTDPVGQMDVTDLTSESNVINIPNPSFPDTPQPNSYQMTRLGGNMDLEFYQPGNVFKRWTWNNGTTLTQDIATENSSTIESSRTQATPKGNPPEPFSTPFVEAFNSHRFGKYNTNNPVGVVGEKGLLPLAGYMMQTAGNQQYASFMQLRNLNLRVRWKLNETTGGNRQSMYSGSWNEGAPMKGFNTTWGHGGDGGTTSADSDLVWDNKWSWTRTHNSTTLYNYRSWCATESTGDSVDSDHADPGSLGNQEDGISADSINTPRAVLGRTLKIEPTLQGRPLETVQSAWKYYIRKNEQGNDRVTLAIPSTIFEFSPTYKMYADYVLDNDRSRESQTETWMLAADKDKVQFMDMVDFNLVLGETVVRAPWSRDFEDTKAVDPNDKTKINVLKSGQAYTVETKNSKLTITAIVHYWDEDFWNISNTIPGAIAPANTPDEVAAKQSAIMDNEVVNAYLQSIQDFYNELSDKDFGFYTNLVGGTSDGSLFRKFATLNPEVFGGATYTHADYGTTMKVADVATADYPKLRLKPDMVTGYVQNYKRINGPTKQTATSGEDYWRLNGGWGLWDSTQATGDTEWTLNERVKFIPDLAAHDSSEILASVMSEGGWYNVNHDGSWHVKDYPGIENGWYSEDYEGIKVAVIRAEITLPAVKSNPATVYEKLSDFRTSMNQWSPKLTHPNVKQDTMGMIGSGDAVLIPKGSIGAGTYLTMPKFTVYPDGINGGGSELSNWTICFKPFRFGLRGSAFDN